MTEPSNLEELDAPRWIERFQSQSDGSPRLTSAQLRLLAAFGALAPTTHNTVPQRFRVDAELEGLELWLDTGRILPGSDPDGRQAHVSLGCVIEAVAIAASCLGRAATFSDAAPFTAARAGLRPIGGMTFPPGGEGLDPSYLSALVERHVLRAEFDEMVCPDPALMQQFRAAAAQRPEVRLSLFTARTERFSAAKFDEHAFKFKLENRSFREELGEWLLPNSDHTSSRGMRGREFGLDDSFTASLRAGLLGQAVLPVDQLSFLARGGREGMVSSPLVLVVHSTEDTETQRLAAGRLAMRCSVEAQRQGFRTAWHTAATEVKHVREMFAAALLPPGSRPIAILRVGVPKREIDSRRPHASRPSLTELLI